MMFKLALLSMILLGCGVESVNLRTGGSDAPDWKVIGTATIHIGKSSGLFAVTPINTNITYTEVEKGVFTLEAGTIAASETDEDNLSLGNIEVKTISVNKLKICGAGGTTKCTVAAIRMYTTGQAEAGFFNTVAGYGIPLTADTLVVGNEIAGATIVSNYVIPPSDRKLRNNDFDDRIYDLNVDISNAEAGDYEMDLTIELVVGI